MKILRLLVIEFLNQDLLFVQSQLASVDRGGYAKTERPVRNVHVNLFRIPSIECRSFVSLLHHFLL